MRAGMTLVRKIILFAGMVVPVVLIAMYSYRGIRRYTIEQIFSGRTHISSLSADVLKGSTFSVQIPIP
jgi:hypothetical protein